MARYVALNYLCSTLLVLLAMLLWIDADGYVLYIASNFRVQWLGFALLLFACAIKIRRPGSIVLAFTAVGLHGWPVLPVWLETIDYAPPYSAVTPLRIMLANVNTSNIRCGEFVAEVAARDPDIVVVEEYGKTWVDGLRPLSIDYPHFLGQPRDDNFGLAIWSRIPLTDGKIDQLGQYALPFIRARIKKGPIEFELIAVHTLPPITEFYEEHRRELAWLASEFGSQTAENSTDHLIIGDLNTAMWTKPFRELLKSSGLTSARQGFGILPTWPTMAPPLRIPLDHILVPTNLGVTNIERFAIPGSDHFGLIADIGAEPESVEFTSVRL